ncbi:dipeptidase 1-like isoform X2 [Zophobas morio]|uniref:dipeptidase 1-like isoform X2 n=1 Tax=Zophobas morio TaxID=2755281 RepID=UPI0030827DCD
MLKQTFFFVIFLLLFSDSSQAPRDDIPGSRALDNFPLIDGHNDLPFNLYTILQNKIYNFSFDADLSEDPLFGSNCSSCFTDLVRARQGKLGAQFWVAYVSCNPVNYNTTVSRSVEQVDVIRRLIAKYPNDLEFVTTADGIVDAFKEGKIASMIGLEGGHSIDSKMSLLRQYYDMGVRYMTLTHSCNLPWADASPVDDTAPVVNLTEFGKKIVLEMNRLGMMVDLSHVSHGVMVEAIETSKAPVIFSHSSAYSVYAHHRNVQDDVLEKVRENDGVVMVNFYSAFIGQGNVTIDDVVKHINHIANVSGVNHVGIGSDYDGVSSVPKGLEDVSKYPDLFDLLKSSNPDVWTIENLEKLAGRNLHRVFKAVEAVRDQLRAELPDENIIPPEDLENGEEDPGEEDPGEENPGEGDGDPQPPEGGSGGAVRVFAHVLSAVVLAAVIISL